MLFHCVLTFTFVQWPSVCWTFLHSLLKRTFKAIEHWQLLLYISMQYSTQPVPSMYEIVEPPLTHLINTSMDIFTNLCNRLISKTDCLFFLLLNFLNIWFYLCTYGSFSPGRGKLAKCGVFLFKIFEAFLWPNGLIFSSFLNCSEEIMSV